MESTETRQSSEVRTQATTDDDFHESPYSQKPKNKSTRSVLIQWIVRVKVLHLTFFNVLRRHHRSGDLHHPVHAGVPHPLHVPSQRHLPHQRGQGQRRVSRRVSRHGHHWHWQPGDHRRIKEGVVHLTGSGRSQMQRDREPPRQAATHVAGVYLHDQ